MDSGTRNATEFRGRRQYFGPDKIAWMLFMIVEVFAISGKIQSHKQNIGIKRHKTCSSNN